jgi:epoxyqueuosine reductase
MRNLAHQLSQTLNRVGYKYKSVSIDHLPELQDEVAKLVRQGLVSKQLCEKWRFYLQTNSDFPGAKMILIVAIPQPITRIYFEWEGIIYPAEIAPNYIVRKDESQVEEIINNVLIPYGYNIKKAHLALKTLAVRSGLAEYGRNNISYVPGMGSFCRLIAFYTDCPCEEDNWQASKAMKACENCSLCRESCPTNSIDKERFLIHAENCLGFLNESKPDIPYWVRLQPKWKNAFVGCMQCQFVCPMNEPLLQDVVTGHSFSNNETSLILETIPWEKLSLKTRQKLEDLQGIYHLLAKNLSALIEKQQEILQP